ncbi:MAG: DUF4349 domain-containing protein, partial [Acetatifactor sp.]|nr:DUF4349 domain-containing protein [Acetatifactor sp.]
MKRKGTRLMTGLMAMIMVLGLMTACGASDSVSQTWNGVASNAGGAMDVPMAEAEEVYYDMDSLGMDMNYSNSEAKPAAAPDGQLQESGAASQQSDRKLIRTVNMSVETKEFDAVMGTLEQRVTELGGYIE